MDDIIPNELGQDQEIDFFESFRANHCPYLGSEDDPLTARAFPTPSNRCYRHAKGVEVPFPLQVNHCLTEEFRSCPIFMEASKAVEKQEKKVNGRTKWASRLAIFLVILLIVLAAFIWWPVPGQSMKEASVFSFWLDSQEASPVDLELNASIEGTTPVSQDTIDAPKAAPIEKPLGLSGEVRANEASSPQPDEDRSNFSVFDYND